jgi:CheY-like chemotaxis protein
MKRIPKILAVDDTPENLRLLEAILGPRGYQLVTAESGTTGLAAVHREQPDLVLARHRHAGPQRLRRMSPTPGRSGHAASSRS